MTIKTIWHLYKGMHSMASELTKTEDYNCYYEDSKVSVELYEFYSKNPRLIPNKINLILSHPEEKTVMLFFSRPTLKTLPAIKGTGDINDRCEEIQKTVNEHKTPNVALADILGITESSSSPQHH